MPRAKVNLSQMFGNATQMSSAEIEIARLQEEIEQLRSSSANSGLEEQLEELRQQLKHQTGIQAISVEEIMPNPDQPRKTFSSQSIDAMAQTFQEDGQLQPIIVIPAGESFLLFDGERRWRAARQLGWQTLQAVTMERPKDLHRKALLTTLHREDLNPLDKAEALLKEITEQTEIPTTEATKILAAVVRRLDYQKRSKQLSGLVTATESDRKQGLQDLDLGEGELAILEVILGLGLNPASVLANDFRMLSLFQDLQEAVRFNGLKAAHAMALQRLSAKNLGLAEAEAASIRSHAIKEVTEQNLTLAETNQLIKQLLSEHTLSPTQAGPSKQVDRVLQGLNKLPISDIKHSLLEKLHQSLQQKLQEIETAMRTK
jgi:ParB family transcriptional regulator, chromosome partitioning protein